MVSVFLLVVVVVVVVVASQAVMAPLPREKTSSLREEFSAYALSLPFSACVLLLKSTDRAFFSLFFFFVLIKLQKRQIF